MKYKKKETQQKYKGGNKNTFSVFQVVGLSLGKTLPGTKGKKHYETRALVIILCLFVGVFLWQTNNKSKTKIPKQQEKQRTK